MKDSHSREHRNLPAITRRSDDYAGYGFYGGALDETGQYGAEQILGSQERDKLTHAKESPFAFHKSGRELDRQARFDRIAEVQKTSYFGIGPRMYKRSDDIIQDEINELLFRHDEIEASDIEVEVKDAEVNLGGKIAHRSMKKLAGMLAAEVFGVKQVNNFLRTH